MGIYIFIVIIKKVILNKLMFNGCKYNSEKCLFKSIKLLQKKIFNKNFEILLKMSLIYNSPFVYFKKFKRRKKVFIEIPFLLKNSLRISYGVKFIMFFVRTNCYFTLYKKFYIDLLHSSKLKGCSFNNIIDFYKKSFINKKLSNYRWF